MEQRQRQSMEQLLVLEICPTKCQHLSLSQQAKYQSEVDRSLSVNLQVGHDS